jgi:hypothetical protein
MMLICTPLLSCKHRSRAPARWRQLAARESISIIGQCFTPPRTT